MKGFRGKNHGKGRIDLTGHGKELIIGRPVEIHLKEDGALDGGPSMVIVVETGYVFDVCGEVTLEMLNQGLADIGYEIRKK